MSGGRIKRAVENMLRIFDQYLAPDDGVAFLRFAARSTVVFPLCAKRVAPRHELAQSLNPQGTTAFRDSGTQLR